MVIREFDLFPFVENREYRHFHFKDVEKSQKLCGLCTLFPHTQFRVLFPIQGPLPISARTPSTVWRNSASTLIASSTLRIEWITVE